MTPHDILLVDDQAIVGEAARAMLAGADDLRLHVCLDPKQALAVAGRLQPSVILQDLVMPGVDGIMLVKFFRASAATRDIPLVVLSSTESAETKARAFAAGASDYIVKLPDAVELLARLRHHAAGRRALAERNEAYRQLEEARAQVADELARAGRYLRRLVPRPMRGDVSTTSLLEPSADLGGDMLSHHALPDGRVAFYVLDVAGHGVGPALHGVSVAAVLRAQALGAADFGRPAEVLRAVNRAFPMEDYDGLHCTLWYGVFDPRTRRLAYASGGHPPALLVRAGGALEGLDAEGTLIGIDPDATFEERVVEPGVGDRIYVFSDGAYEIETADGSMLEEAAFHAMLLAHDADLEGYVRACRELRGGAALDDDCTILRVEIGA